MKSFLVATVVLIIIWCSVFSFSFYQEKNLDQIFCRLQMLSEDQAFSEEENIASAHKAEEMWQEKLWFLELAVEEEYLTPVTASFADMTAGCDSCDLSRYLSGKAGVKEGISKLRSINKFSISQIL